MSLGTIRRISHEDRVRLRLTVAQVREVTNLQARKTTEKDAGLRKAVLSLACTQGDYDTTTSRCFALESIRYTLFIRRQLEQRRRKLEGLRQERREKPKLRQDHGTDTDPSLCQIDNLGTILIESNGKTSTLGGHESNVIVIILVDDGAASFPLDTLSLNDWSGVPLLTLETNELA